MQCEEVEGLSLNDGAVRIFLNTHGKKDKDVSQELIELLHYIEHTTEEVSRKCTSGKIKTMQERIAAIKSSEEIGVKYMQEWEEKIIEKRKAREEGRVNAKAEAVLDLLEDLGDIPEEVRQKIIGQHNLAILKEWLKYAAKSETIEEFADFLK